MPRPSRIRAGIPLAVPARPPPAPAPATAPPALASDCPARVAHPRSPVRRTQPPRAPRRAAPPTIQPGARSPPLLAPHQSYSTALASPGRTARGLWLCGTPRRAARISARSRGDQRSAPGPAGRGAQRAGPCRVDGAERLAYPERAPGVHALDAVDHLVEPPEGGGD